MCKMHDAFGTLATAHHNCLGCNFANSINMIGGYLDQKPNDGLIQYSFTTYLLLQYLLVERIDTLFNIIQLNTTYRIDKFKVLLEVRRWANFIKHPKAFLLTHHPEYTFVGGLKNKELMEQSAIVIDRKFIDKYYSNEEKNAELFKELENKENVLVMYPNLVQVTENMCQAMLDCIAVIRDNSVYRDVLSTRTTFLDYWADIAPLMTTETKPDTSKK